MSGSRCCCGEGETGPTSCAEVDYCNTEACYEIDIRTYRKLHILAGFNTGYAYDANGNPLAVGTPLWWAYLDLDVDISGTVCYRGRDARVGTNSIFQDEFPFECVVPCVSDPCDEGSGSSLARVWGSGPCPEQDGTECDCKEYFCDPLDSTVSLDITANRRLEILVDHRRGSPTSTLFTAGVETATIARTMPAEARMHCHTLIFNSALNVCDYSGAPAFLLTVAPYYLDTEVPFVPPGSYQYCSVDTEADAWLDWPTPTQSAAWTGYYAQNISAFRSPTIDFRAGRPRHLPFLFPFNPTKSNIVGKIDADPTLGVDCRSWEGTYSGTPPTSAPTSVLNARTTYPSDWTSYIGTNYVSVYQFGTPATISLAVCP